MVHLELNKSMSQEIRRDVRSQKIAGKQGHLPIIIFNILLVKMFKIVFECYMEKTDVDIY